MVESKVGVVEGYTENPNFNIAILHISKFMKLVPDIGYYTVG